MVRGTERGVMSEYMGRSEEAGKLREKGRGGKWEGQRRDHKSVYVGCQREI